MTRKERVALVSLVASLSLTAAKLSIGLMIGSLALVTDALHSGTDAIATLVTFLAVRFADRPADDDHPYGHGKFEDLAALGEGTLLLVLAGGVAVEAWNRFAGAAPPPSVGVIAFAVLGAEIVINLWRAWALNKTAKETGSRALAADAMHFLSDVASSVIVIVGFVATLYGADWADSVTAAAIAVFIGWLGLRMIRRTIDELTDRVPPAIARTLRRLLLDLPGVVAIDQLRVRTVGPRHFVDISAAVPRTFSFDETAAVKRAMVAAILDEIEDAEATVSLRPVPIDDESVRERVFLAASRERIPVHHITIQHLGDRLSVSLDCEVEGSMPLGEAHEVASRLEAAVRAEIGAEIEVETHLEPLYPDLIPGERLPEDRVAAYAATLRAAADKHGVSDVHNVRVREIGEGLFVAFHCRFPATLSAAEVHRRADAVERMARAAFPEIRRIVSHPEPLRE
ncbi:cation-efflux pump [Pleomorphomonas sp. JP5]|uniref:cation-efflux pump n=1 Tax=Pleomorphomonas sp. JP5 TaxID=2942998 RepID=UPI00204464FC|nr:cation-efflux pump [Pleomorphomonas sp. JP5]MCM5559973.1 cation-efflux pump [Pleomorphomonas sp. JP5]